MTDREIALQLTLKLIETGHFFAGKVETNEDYGRETAAIYNEIIKGISQE